MGTIGGGAVEGRSIQLCRELLDQRRSCIREFPLHQAPGGISAWCAVATSRPISSSFRRRTPVERHRQPGPGSAGAAHRRVAGAGGGRLCSGAAGPGERGFRQSAGGYRPGPADPGLLHGGGIHLLPLSIGQRALLFGAGHISQALCPLLVTVGFRPVVFDCRPELATTRLFPTAEQVICGDFTRISDYLTVTEEDFVVIMTSGHMRDFQVEEQTLRGDFAYVGSSAPGAKRRR